MPQAPDAGEPRPRPPPTEDTEPDVDVAQHPAAIILGSHVPPKGIRVSVNKCLFDNFPPAIYDALPARMVGEVERCNTATRASTAPILSTGKRTDNSNTVQNLAVLLKRRWLRGESGSMLNLAARQRRIGRRVNTQKCCEKGPLVHY